MVLAYKYKTLIEKLILLSSGHVAGFHLYKTDPESGANNYLRC